jgi:hypothetical protein
LAAFRGSIKMLRKSKFRCVAAISLSFNVLGLAPAVAGDCRFDGCGGGYVVQQTLDFYGRASTYAGYASVFARYCDGYGGGQNPYASCSVGRTEYIAPIPPPAFAVTKAPASPPGPSPIVTKYSADYDDAPLPPPAVVAKAPAPPGPLPIVTKYRADAH